MNRAGSAAEAAEAADVIMMLRIQLEPGDPVVGGETVVAIFRPTDPVLLDARTRARKERDWAEADRIRDQLQDAGVILEDGAGGTTWRRG